MAVKAAEQITITDMTDVKSFCRYYLLQSSTLAAPSKPTTNPPPSSWTTTELTYTAGSTNSLYFTDLTVFSNDTFSYSDVSLSSSYEAAKTAYNKAVEAAKTATNYIDYSETDGLQVGNKQSGSWVGARTQMTSNAFNILSSAGEKLASYGETLIELGKNAKEAVIKMCASAGQIFVTNNEEYGGDTLTVVSDRVVFNGKQAAGVEANRFAAQSQSVRDPATGQMIETSWAYESSAWNRMNCYEEPAGAGTGAANVRIGASYRHETDDVEDANEESAITITESNINIRASQAVNIEAKSVNVNGLRPYSFDGMALLGEITTYNTTAVTLTDNISNYKGVYVVTKVKGSATGIMNNVNFVPCLVLNDIIESSEAINFSVYSDNSTSYYCNIELLLTDTTMKLKRSHKNNFDFLGIKLYGVK